MEQKLPHIRYTERIEPKRRFIRTGGALYLVLLLGAFAAIFLSRALAAWLQIKTLYVQIVLFGLLLGTWYWVYRTRLVEYLYELYDSEFCVVQAVGEKKKTILTVPLSAVAEVGPYRKTDAKPTLVTFHGRREETTAIWFSENGKLWVACLNASDTMKEKLSEALHAKE